MDAGRRVVIENSSVVDIAPMEGAMVGIAGSISQKSTVEKRHLMQEIELLIKVEVLAVQPSRTEVAGNEPKHHFGFTEDVEE